MAAVAGGGAAGGARHPPVANACRAAAAEGEQVLAVAVGGGGVSASTEWSGGVALLTGPASVRLRAGAPVAVSGEKHCALSLGGRPLLRGASRCQVAPGRGAIVTLPRQQRQVLEDRPRRRVLGWGTMPRQCGSSAGPRWDMFSCGHIQCKSAGNNLPGAGAGGHIQQYTAGPGGVRAPPRPRPHHPTVCPAEQRPQHDRAEAAEAAA